MNGRSDVDELSRIFNLVVDAPADRQQALLHEICDDEPLRAQVLQLLAVDACPDPLLDHELFPEPPQLEPGQQVAGYHLVRELARGGMGIVYHAEQLEPIRRSVALKVIKPGVDTREVIGRFNAERQALSLMDHPNIAKVLDAGSTPSGHPFFVMELVSGQPITTYCEQRRLPIRGRLELFSSVCRAIHHAHQKGVIHRDIKPSNVLVADYENEAVAKVIDFGVAKAIDQKLTDQTINTRIGQIVGTIDYMSPEQTRWNQADVDTRSDIYSLGVLLYELLTAAPPFDRERMRSLDLEEALRVVREEDPVRPSVALAELGAAPWSESPTRLAEAETTDSGVDSLGSHVSDRSPQRSASVAAKQARLVRGELDWITMKALEKDRDRRYETANELAGDIARFLRGEAVEACPPSRMYRFRKFVRRNRTALASAGVVAMSFFMLVIGLSYQAVRISRADAKANDAAIEFLVEDLLGVDDAQVADGYSPDPNLKLLILLRNAKNRIDQRFADNPDVKARMQATLANSFNSLGQYDDAKKLYNRYLAFLKETVGTGDPDTIRVMRRLLRIHISESHWKEAERLAEEALGYARDSLGEDAPTTLQLMNDHAMLQHKLGDDETAIESFQQVLATRLRLLGKTHTDTLDTMSNLADVYDGVGRADEACAIREDVVLAYRSSFVDPNTARLAAAFQKLGIGLLEAARRAGSLGQTAKAAEHLEASLVIYASNRGDDHRDTLETKYRLAQARVELRQIDAARPLLEDLSTRLRRLRNADDKTLLDVMNMYGWTLINAGQFAEAEYELTAAFEQLQNDGPIRPGTGGSEEGTAARLEPLCRQVMGNLAIARFRMGKIDAAVTLDERALARMSETLAAEHPDVLAAKARLGLGYLRQGRREQARRLLEEVNATAAGLAGANKIADILDTLDESK